MVKYCSLTIQYMNNLITRCRLGPKVFLRLFGYVNISSKFNITIFIDRKKVGELNLLDIILKRRSRWCVDAFQITDNRDYDMLDVHEKIEGCNHLIKFQDIIITISTTIFPTIVNMIKQTPYHVSEIQLDFQHRLIKIDLYYWQLFNKYLTIYLIITGSKVNKLCNYMISLYTQVVVCVQCEFLGKLSHFFFKKKTLNCELYDKLKLMSFCEQKFC